MKPMLATDVAGDTSSLKYPLYASPKLDGVRAIVDFRGQVLSRSLKLIPNVNVQRDLGHLPSGLDGELIVGAPNEDETYRRTVSAVMSDDIPIKDLRFYVFDVQPDSANTAHWEYRDRLERLGANAVSRFYGAKVQLLQQQWIETEEALAEYEAAQLEAGYEGVMVRSPNGLYKYGRSTIKEGYLLKVKRFCDAEAKVVGYTEMLHNENEAKTNALGQTERSSHKAGKVASGVLGALQCAIPGTELTFDIGTGFTAEQRKLLWAQRNTLVGRTAKYKYFPTGSKERPRFPVWLGFRDQRDM